VEIEYDFPVQGTGTTTLLGLQALLLARSRLALKNWVRAPIPELSRTG